MRVKTGKFSLGLWGAALLTLTGCNRHQSALAPFGEDAAEIQGITIVLVAGALVIATAVAALMIWAVRLPEDRLTLPGASA
jgi:cytochrome c oxidase subunit 2